MRIRCLAGSCPTTVALLVSAMLLGCASDRDGPTPRIDSVDPNTIVLADRDATVTVHGANFSPTVDGALTTPRVVMPTVRLIGQDGVEYEVNPQDVSFPAGDTSGTTLVVHLPQDFVPPRDRGEPEAVYDLKIENPNGHADVLEDAIRVIPPPDYFDLVSIDPPFGCTCDTTTVTITSGGLFVSTPEVFLTNVDDINEAPGVAEDDRFYLQRVAFVDASTLTAVVPSGLPIGTYDVVVVNPPSVGSVGIMSDGFRVVNNPVPVIVGIVPGRGNTQDDTPVTIFGENFRAPAHVELIDQNDNIAVTVAANVVSDGEITATFPTTTMTAAPYLVRVVNEDEETYFTFAGFLVTNPSGNLNVFQNDSQLTTARRMLCGVSAKDDLGNTFVYAIGGDAGAGGEVYDSVEIAQLSKFGALSAWHEQHYALNTPRAGASAVAVPVFAPGKPFVPIKTYVYVLGGHDGNGNVLDSVERSVVLSSVDAPLGLTATIAEPDGSLAAGYWYYKVSAVLAANDADNPGGETLASDEAIIRVEDGDAVALTWDAVTVGGQAAASYRVYRTDAANGASGQEHLIAEVTDTSYTDTGDAPGTVSPLGTGATGHFVEVGSMTMPRWGQVAVLARDAAGDRSIVVLGGKNAMNGGVQASLERAAVADDGTIGAFSTNGMTPMSEPRAFHSAAVETSDNVATYRSDASRLWAVAGISTGLDTVETLEESDVSAAGNGAWTVNGKRVATTAGAMAVIVNEKLFVLGGATVANDTTFSSVTPNGRDTEFDNQGNISGSINSTASSLLQPRAFGVGVPGAGFIYFIGGTSDGNNAVATTERTY